MSKSDKGRLPPFVPLLISTIDSRAWRAMSPRAKILYVALKRRVPNGRNRTYLSYREAVAEVRSSRRVIARLFQELRHYGFIVLEEPHCLGVDGKGKSPHWRLTELGVTSRASAGGMFEPPTNDFLKWDGTDFRPAKKQNPSSHGSPHRFPRVATSVSHGSPLEDEIISPGVAIEATESVSHGVAITSLTTMGVLNSEPAEQVHTNVAPSLQTQLPDDPRIQALARWESASN